MAIAFRSQTSLGGTAASVSVILPSGAIEGDILVVDIGTAGATVTGVPSGWTAITNVQTGLTARLFAYYHFVGASDPGPWSFTLSASGAYSHICSCYEGVDITTPLDVAAATIGNNTAGTTIIVPAVTTVNTNTMLHSGTVEGATNRTITMPTGMTTIVEVTVGRRQEAAWQAIAATGTTGTRTWTFSGSVVRNAYMVPLRAATSFPATMTAGTATATAAAGGVNLAHGATGPTIATAARIGLSGSWAARSGFATATAFYAVMQDTADSGIEVWKSTDGATWTQQDAANEPTNTSTVGAGQDSFGAGQRGSDGDLQVGYFPSAGNLTSRRFAVGTDTWVAGTLGTFGGNVVREERPISVAVRSDDDVLLYYNTTDGTNAATYGRYEGAGWSTASVNGLSTRPQDIAIAPGDRAFIAIGDDATSDNSYRVVDSANTLWPLLDFDATAHATDRPLVSRWVVYNDGTNDKVGLLGRDDTGELDYYHGTQGDTLTSLATVDAVSSSTTPQTTSVDLVVFNNKIYALWAEANAIVYRSTTSLTTLTFGSETTLLAALADTDVCPQFLVGLSALGVLYQEAGSVKLEWIVAPVNAGASFPAGTATATAAGETVTLDAASALTSGTATATGAAAAVALAGQARIGVTAATATAAAGSSTLTAASRLTVSAATATATAQAVNLAAAQAAALVSGTATAAAQAEAVTLKGQGALALTAAPSTAQAEAVTFATAARMIAGTATATADGQAITFDAASRLTVIAAPATAETQNVTLGAGGAATLTVTPAAATAASGAVLFRAPATMTSGTATANAAATSNLTAASRMIVSPAIASSVTIGGNVFGAGSIIISPALATAQAGASVLRGMSRFVIDVAIATAQTEAVDLFGGIPLPPPGIIFPSGVLVTTFAASRDPLVFAAGLPNPTFEGGE